MTSGSFVCCVDCDCVWCLGFCCSEQPEEKALEMLGKMTDWRIKERVEAVAKMKISFKPDFAETWHSGIHG